MRQRPTRRAPTARVVVASGAERRRSPRIPAGAPAVLVGGDKRWDVEVTELSRHGARVCGRGAFDVGLGVVLELSSSRAGLALPARVVWVVRARRRVGGLDFAPLAPALLGRLDEVLARFAAEVAAASPPR